MNYDKRMPDGKVVLATEFTYRVLNGIPVLFRLAEWLLYIVAFQFVAEKFNSKPALTVWMLLALALSMYVGVLVSNVAWRYIDKPFDGRFKNIVISYLLPLASSGVVFFLLRFVVKDMVAAQIG